MEPESLEKRAPSVGAQQMSIGETSRAGRQPLSLFARNRPSKIGYRGFESIPLIRDAQAVSSLQLVHLEAEDQLPAEMQTLVARIIQEAAVKLKTLGDLETVKGKSNGHGLEIVLFLLGALR